MRVAAIDCGTNSIRLLIAEQDQSGLVDVDRRMEVVRLGEGVDRRGRLGDAALARTFAACQRYADTIAGHGVEALRFVATSASRDAANADEFAAGVQEILGVRPEVVTGLVEADLSFVGASRSLPDLPAPALVVDIGGGSTEFVLGRRHAAQAVSVDIGCVRLTERHLRTDPPGRAELAAVRRDADDSIARAGQQVDFGAAACLVGLPAARGQRRRCPAVRRADRLRPCVPVPGRRRRGHPRVRCPVGARSPGRSACGRR